MKSFKDYIAERWNITMPEGNISGTWFAENRIPMIVKCTCCEMTMASPSAWIDDDGYVFCGECSGMNNPCSQHG